MARGADNHLPNESRIQDWRVKMETHSPFHGLYVFGQLFSDLASKNTELRQFGECLEKRIHIPAMAPWKCVWE
jgi:hypothetical protein